MFRSASDSSLLVSEYDENDGEWNTIIIYNTHVNANAKQDHHGRDGGHCTDEARPGHDGEYYSCDYCADEYAKIRQLQLLLLLS